MRSSSQLLTGACFLTLAALPAAAATVPKISGTYTLTDQSVCPIIVTTTKNAAGALNGISSPVFGDASGLIATLTFTPGAGTPNAGTVSGTGYSYETGGLLQLPGGTLQPAGTAVTVSSTYTNTATTFTLVGGLGPDTVIYGTIKNGIAQSFHYVGPSIWPKGSATMVTCVDTGGVVHN